MTGRRLARYRMRSDATALEPPERAQACGSGGESRERDQSPGLGTDKSGKTTPPTAIAWTLLWKREGTQWKIINAHQSFAPAAAP